MGACEHRVGERGAADGYRRDAPVGLHQLRCLAEQEEPNRSRREARHRAREQPEPDRRLLQRAGLAQRRRPLRHPHLQRRQVEVVELGASDRGAFVRHVGGDDNSPSSPAIHFLRWLRRAAQLAPSGPPPGGPTSSHAAAARRERFRCGPCLIGILSAFSIGDGIPPRRVASKQASRTMT